jgi:hypothetical protein
MPPIISSPIMVVRHPDSLKERIRPFYDGLVAAYSSSSIRADPLRK